MKTFGRIVSRIAPALLVLWTVGSLPAATIEGTRIYVTPTLLSPNGGTLVTATLSGGARFYTGTTPPPYRIRLTQGSDLLDLLEPETVTQTRLTFRFPKLPVGYYGFQARVEQGGAWVLVHQSSPRFFKVDTEPRSSSVFEAYPDGITPRNTSVFLDTAEYSARGTLTGRVEVPQSLGSPIVDIDTLKDYCVGFLGIEECSQGGAIFKIDVGLDGRAYFDFSIPIEAHFDFPLKVCQGQTVRFYATSITYPGPERLTVERTGFDYSTLHRLAVNVPWDGLPLFDLNLHQLPDKLVVWGQVPTFPGFPALPVPEIAIGDEFDDGDAEFGGVRMRLGGKATWTTTGNYPFDIANTYHQLWTREATVSDLWFHGGDQITFLAIAPIPGVQAAAAALKTADVKLYQDFKLDVVSRDYLHLFPPDPFVEVSIQADAALGNTRIRQTMRFKCEYFLLSQVIYRLTGGFDTDLPLIGFRELVAWDLSDVGYHETASDRLTNMVEVQLDLPVEVVSRYGYTQDYLAPYDNPLVNVGNFTADDAARERNRISSLICPKPPLPPLVSATVRTNYPINPESACPLILSCSPAVAGTILANPLPTKGGYAAGTTVTLRADPAPGYRFVGWSGSVTGSANPTALALNEGTRVNALFETALPPLGLANPSFEADTFRTIPGYVKDNGPISGWTAEAYMGLNPVAPFNPDNHYFTDNGTIPDGQ
ncbi:MAG TPA: hypothetical protein PK640_05280, partial [Verrucomicrobiota bacterium]|nr:hypothetical protein [Verrucomicrobiota bacterium]